MSTQLRIIILPLVVALLFSGCSFEDIFSKLATTTEEQGAGEAYTRSKIVEAKQQKMTQMKQQFPESIDLNNVTDATKGVGVAYRKIEATGTTLNVEVMLPDAGRQVYEVWLRESGGKNKIRLGVLQFNQTDDYSFAYTSDKNLSQYATVLISREAVPDDIQETIVMTGTFTVTPTNSPLP